MASALRSPRPVAAAKVPRSCSSTVSARQRRTTSTSPITPGFRERPFLAYDAPGCGESSCEDLSKLSIPFLVDTAKALLRKAGIERFHLVGHSMGGLTALLLAHQDRDRVLSFVDIEGNVAPEDCVSCARHASTCA